MLMRGLHCVELAQQDTCVPCVLHISRTKITQSHLKSLHPRKEGGHFLLPYLQNSFSRHVPKKLSILVLYGKGCSVAFDINGGGLIRFLQNRRRKLTGTKVPSLQGIF